MGIWDYISSTTDSALKPVKNLCWSSYSCSRDFVCKIEFIKLYQQLPKEEIESTINQFAVASAKNTLSFAGCEGLKLILGGGPIYDIVLRSLRDSGTSQDRATKELKALKSELEIQKQEVRDHAERIKELQALVDGMTNDAATPRIQRPRTRFVVGHFISDSPHSMVYKESEDVIRDFMLMGFMNTDILDHLKLQEKLAACDSYEK